MKIPILNYFKIENYNKKVFLSSLYFYVISLFLGTFLITYNFNINKNFYLLMFLYSIYFIFNFLSIGLITYKFNETITEYRNRIITLEAIKKIYEEDKKEMFKTIKKLKTIKLRTI